MRGEENGTKRYEGGEQKMRKEGMREGKEEKRQENGQQKTMKRRRKKKQKVKNPRNAHPVEIINKKT